MLQLLVLKFARNTLNPATFEANQVRARQRGTNPGLLPSATIKMPVYSSTFNMTILNLRGTKKGTYYSFQNKGTRTRKQRANKTHLN